MAAATSAPATRVWVIDPTKPRPTSAAPDTNHYDVPTDAATEAKVRSLGYVPQDEAGPPQTPAPGSVPAGGGRGFVPAPTPSVSGSKQLAGMDPWGFLKVAGPSIAATAMTGGMDPAAGILAHFLVPYLASLGTRTSLDAMSGSKPDLGGNALSALLDAAPLTAGHAAGGFLSELGGKGLDAAYAVPKSAADDAVRIASSQASRVAGAPTHVPYSDPAADIPSRLEATGVVPGPAPKGGLLSGVAPRTGSLGIRDAMSGPMNERTALLEGFKNAGITGTRQDFTQFVPQARAEIARGLNGTKNVEAFNNMLQDFIDQGRTVPGAPLKGNPMAQMDPTQWEADKELWAKTAKYGSDPETQAVKARLSAALADGVRTRIEALTPPAVPGGIGRIEELNRKYQTMIPLRDVVDNAELPRSGPPGASLKNPLGGMPYNEAGRAGLALRGPGVQNTARYGPEALTTIARILALSHPAESRH